MKIDKLFLPKDKSVVNNFKQEKLIFEKVREKILISSEAIVCSCSTDYLPEIFPKKVSAPDTCGITKCRHHHLVPLLQFSENFKMLLFKAMKKPRQKSKYERKIITRFMILTTGYESNPEAAAWKSSEKNSGDSPEHLPTASDIILWD